MWLQDSLWVPADSLRAPVGEVALFFQNETLALRRRKVGLCLFVRTSSLAVGLIRRQAGERDQPLRLVVAALMRHKLAQQVLTQAGDDAGPDFGVDRELVFLERVDLVADKAGDGHGDSFCVLMQGSLGARNRKCFGERRNSWMASTKV